MNSSPRRNAPHMVNSHSRDRGSAAVTRPPKRPCSSRTSAARKGVRSSSCSRAVVPAMRCWEHGERVQGSMEGSGLPHPQVLHVATCSRDSGIATVGYSKTCEGYVNDMSFDQLRPAVDDFATTTLYARLVHWTARVLLSS